MALTIALEDALGRTIREAHDPDNVLLRLVREEGDDFICLRYVDPWGHTVFNTLQMKPFLAEMERVMSHTHREWELAVLRSTRELARQCGGENHLYLKFYGD